MVSTTHLNVSQMTGTAPPVIVHPDGNVGVFNASNYKKKYLVLVVVFSAYDKSATNEIKAFSKLLPNFEAQNCMLLGISRDSPPVLTDWMSQEKEFAFPIISDLNLADSDFGLSQRLGISLNQGYPTSSLIVVDKSGIIRYISSNTAGYDQSANEIFRIVEALNSVVDAGKGQKLVPANWKSSDQFIWNTREHVDYYYAKKYSDKGDKDAASTDNKLSEPPQEYDSSVFSFAENDN